MDVQAYLIQALSPLHAGTGQAVGVIDLPIARMRATGIPFVPGSSIKGVLKDARRSRDGLSRRNELYAVFGPDRGESGQAGDHGGHDPEQRSSQASKAPDDDRGIEHAGALMVGDARLLALPVRSFRGTFAYVSSPLLLHLARRDLLAAGASASLPAVPEMAPPVRRACVANKDFLTLNGKAYFEDITLGATQNDSAVRWGECLAAAMQDDDKASMRDRFAIVDDDTMAFFWETATQVDTRVRIDHGTHVVADRQLWTEESLPSETLLMGLMGAHGSRRANTAMTPAEVLGYGLPVTDNGEYVQFGGKATVGKGRCALYRWNPVASGGKQ